MIFIFVTGCILSQISGVRSFKFNFFSKFWSRVFLFRIWSDRDSFKCFHIIWFFFDTLLFIPSHRSITARSSQWFNPWEAVKSCPKRKYRQKKILVRFGSLLLMYDNTLQIPTIWVVGSGRSVLSQLITAMEKITALLKVLGWPHTSRQTVAKLEHFAIGMCPTFTVPYVGCTTFFGI